MNKYLFLSDYFSNYTHFVDDIMNKRGNWEIVKEGDKIDYLYLDGKYFWDEKTTGIYKKAYIKNVVNFSKIINKHIFYKLFKEHNDKAVKQYMMYQYHILPDKYTLIDKNIFINKIWIVKPVNMGKGAGVEVIINYEQFINYMINFNKNKHKYLTSDRGVVLEEYIQRPLLLNGYKFHMRVYYLYFNNKGYLFRRSQILRARNLYEYGDWNNKLIHDTHYFGFPYSEYPEDFIKEYGTNKEQNVFNQMLDLFGIITEFIKPKCYTNEATYCYHIFGGDIMILEDFSTKLLEINHYIGMKSTDDSDRYKNFVYDFLEGQIEITVDTIIEPKNNIKRNNLFIPVNTKLSNKSGGFYFKKYKKYKTKYLELQTSHL